MAEEDWTPYQKMEAGILKDISCDTDEILRKLEGKHLGRRILRREDSHISNRRRTIPHSPT